MTHTPRIPSLLMLAALVASPLASAIGLGSGPASVVLGQPLDFRVPVRLDAGETLEAECVQAEVRVGDGRPLPATLEVAAAAPAGAIRVQSNQRVDEPIVTVTLSVGCLSPVQRRYVVMADPPMFAAAPQALAPRAVGEVAEADRPSAVASPVTTAGSTAPAPATGAVTDGGVSSGAATPAAAPQAAPRRTASPRPRDPAARSASASARPPAAPRRTARRTSDADRRTATATTTAPGRPRLQLDPEVPPLAAAAPVGAAVIEEAFAAVAEAASAARAAAAAASASALRVAELERAVEESRRQALGSQAEVLRLRAELAQRSAAPVPWLWPLLALVAFGAVALGWLLWRLRGIQRTQELAWARASALAASELPTRESSPLPLVSQPQSVPATAPATLAIDPARVVSPSSPADGRPPGPGRAGAPAATVTRSALPPATAGDFSYSHLDQLNSIPSAPTLAGEPYVERTQVLPPRPLPVDEAARAVSIEELIDVDQQAEFFIALGQDQAAIDVLVAHLRSTGGASPLTYLKLLEIYRRVGDQAAYDRTRIRFNQRYNAYAPEWGEDLSAGRTLEDHDDVIRRLQAAWSRPLDAMAELDSLLFRKVDGELFELQAYRDLLFLYALARDLMDREEGDPDLVDLLLPLDARAPRVGAVGDARATADIPLDDRPTAPLDLDLTPPPRAHESIFEPPRSGGG